MTAAPKVKPTWKDLRREVRDAGGVLDRQGATSIETWRLPSGDTVRIQAKNENEQVTRSVRDRIRETIASRKEKK